MTIPPSHPARTRKSKLSLTLDVELQRYLLDICDTALLSQIYGRKPTKRQMDVSKVLQAFVAAIRDADLNFGGCVNRTDIYTKVLNELGGFRRRK
jgi:hypothetical protein